jgi:hypothetical protein
MLSVMMDDDQLLYRGDEARDATLRRMKALGVDHVRVTVLWEVVAENAKVDRRGRKRRSFKADDPRTYPKGNWDRYDRLVHAGKTLGVGIYFNVTGPGPSWAHQKAPRSARPYARYWKPKPREFFKFVKAVGKRYDGKYVDENDGRTTLPAVTFWSIWNEPNQNGWLLPQWEKGIPASPILYRELWYYGRAALDQTGHGSDVVLAGETAPLGSGLRNMRSPIYPKRFIRELFCIDPKGRRYTGTAAAKRRCSRLKKIGQWRYTAWGHHPYTKLLAPTRRDKSRDSITMANIGELSSLLDQIGDRTGLLRKPNMVASTEFGYETNPPDKFVGISLDRQAEYINTGDYLAWKDPRVMAQTQFLLRDVEGIKRYRKASKKHWFTYQSGLMFADGRPKPGASAYLLPLQITGTGVDSVGQNGVTFWGWLRFLPYGTQTEVSLQFRPQGAADFSTIGDPVKVTDPFGFWTAHRAVPVPGTWRAVWVNPVTGGPIVSRQAEYKG